MFVTLLRTIRAPQAPLPTQLSSRNRTSTTSRVNIFFPCFLLSKPVDHRTEPLFLSCAEIDHTFPTEFRNRAVDILNAEKKKYCLQLFQGVEHGFALRGNLDDPYERKCTIIVLGFVGLTPAPGWTKEQSLRGIADWFDLWLAQ